MPSRLDNNGTLLEEVVISTADNREYPERVHASCSSTIVLNPPCQIIDFLRQVGKASLIG